MKGLIFTRIANLIVLAIVLCNVTDVQKVQAQTHDPAEYLSHTLPVLYINTVDSMPITSRDYYLDGSYYLDSSDFEQFESIGSAEEPLALQIRGRGNASWQAPKKPYRLKLGAKAALCGMKKSKHWVLLTEYNDWQAHGRNYFGMLISRMMNMPWTPGIVPIELVLNGDYMGMYFLLENIRIDKNRVNITEQDNFATDSAEITGGWLLEIDNYNEPNQIKLKDRNTIMRITYHSPDSLSDSQLAYITDLVTRANDAVNTNAKNDTTWETLIDIDAMARFYVVNEVIDNQEAFSGSCWFYKDRGDSTKLIFGPVWDFGSAQGRNNCKTFLYENPPSYAVNHWIQELVKFPRFQMALRKHWRHYRDNVYPQLQTEVTKYKNLVINGLAADYKRWGDKSATEVGYYTQRIMKLFKSKYEFLQPIWDEDFTYLPGDINGDNRVDVTDVNVVINLILRKNEQIPRGDGSFAYDVNNDGMVDVADLNMVINFMLGKFAE